MEGAGQEGRDSGGKAQWLVTLQKKVEMFDERLPTNFEALKRESALVKNPLFRFLEREISVLVSLLKTVRKDFKLVLDVCTGESKSTNAAKIVMESLHADIVPNHWKKYIVPPSMTASDWLMDFKKRVD